MRLPGATTHEFGPENASLQVKTYREGMAARVGHDLVLDVTGWAATLSVGPDGTDAKLELTADPGSLKVREGLNGLKPLSSKDRSEIEKSIEGKVLRGAAISFRSDRFELLEEGNRIAVSGELEIGGSSNVISVQLNVDSARSASCEVSVVQSKWGIKPYSALMGALKVRDELDVVCVARLPAA